MPQHAPIRRSAAGITCPADASTDLTAHAAETRLAQYGERTASTYGSSAEKDLHQIAMVLLDELNRLRTDLGEAVVETGFRDSDGQVWRTEGIPPRTVELMFRTNPTLRRTVRTTEWTEVTS